MISFRHSIGPCIAPESAACRDVCRPACLTTAAFPTHADHARATRANVGNAELGARRLSRRSFIVRGTQTRQLGIDSFGIESPLLEVLGFGFAPASLRSAAFCRAW
jgi:hypothetical protein